MVIGGVAYNVHAPPRTTKDLDLWVRPEVDNLDRLIVAIRQFGFPTTGLDAQNLAGSRKVLILGRAPNRIDLLTRPAGLDWSQAWPRRASVCSGNLKLDVLSVEDLIQAKRAAGRPRDLADVAMLEKVVARTKKAP